MLFIRKLIKRVRHQESEFINNRVSETIPEVKCKLGQVVSSSALYYFFQKCTLEIKHFIDKKVYEKICEERKGIL